MKVLGLHLFPKKKRRIHDYNGTFNLDPEGIETFSETLDYLLQEMEIEGQNRIRIRLSYEESLLRMRDHFGEENQAKLRFHKKMGRFYIQMEVEGEIFNPLSKLETDLEDWSGSLLTSIGLAPQYRYVGGCNILRLNMNTEEMSAALKILLSVGLGLISGYLLSVLLPREMKNYLVEDILGVFYTFWVRILSVLSGPVIFVMVCTSVLNTSSVREEGASSTYQVLRYFIFSITAALAALMFLLFIYGNRIPIQSAGSWGIKEYLNILLMFMPDNILEPFMTSNTPQLLLLAFVLADCIALLGPSADSLNRLVHQCNTVGLLITNGVSKMVPFFAAILLCMEILDKNLDTFYGIWFILVLSLLLTIIVLLGQCLYISVRKEVPFAVLFKKLWPDFLKTLISGNLETGFVQMERSCVEKLGLEKHYTTVNLRCGLVLYMPANVIGTFMFTLYAAWKEGVQISPGWIFVAMLLTVILFVATPPVPGANLLAYIVIFAQLGISSVALIDAMIFDILFGIFATAGNQALLQMELISQADRIGLLNRKRLRKE